MILVLNIGNTTIRLGCFEEDRLLFTSAISTSLDLTEDEYGIRFREVLKLYDVAEKEISGAILASVVPRLTDRIHRAVEKITGCRPMVVGPGLKTGLNIRIDNPGSLGADLVAECVAALYRYPLPCIVVDFGTAISFSVLNDNGSMVGGALLPGIAISLEALKDKTSLLTEVGIRRPKKAIGTNTEDCLLSGALMGNAALVDGLCDRFEEELEEDCCIVLTGNLGKEILPLCRREAEFNENLLLDGLRLIYEKNLK